MICNTTDFQGGEPLSFDDRNAKYEDIDRVNAPYGRNPITGELIKHQELLLIKMQY